MLKALIIMAAAAVLLLAGCQSPDSGHREYIPGKGWVPVKGKILGG
ncbi:MAG: hypothetical protein P8M70_14135 [Verrucomicrobiota bacterium]|jgi:hypothetical protein|nr:hypothetical protein [Verrucomicrobiota bacterium]